MFITNQFIKDDESPYIKTYFPFDHNGESIDINIEFRIVEECIQVIIIDFKLILHYFVNETQDELRSIEENISENYVEYMDIVHNRLIDFFYEEEYLNKEGIMQIFTDNGIN